jgi:hypothetical protein
VQKAISWGFAWGVAPQSPKRYNFCCQEFLGITHCRWISPVFYGKYNLPSPRPVYAILWPRGMPLFLSPWPDTLRLFQEGDNVFLLA